MSKDPKLRLKTIVRLINQLRNIGPNSNAPIKFIVDKTPFDDDNEPSSSEECVVTGRLLPNSDLYKQGALEVQIKIGTGFPFQPPNVFITTPMYHPNVERSGEVCIDLLSGKATWTPITSLVTVVEEVTKIIDEPSTDYIKYPEAASLYNTNKAEYERIAGEKFRQNCKPRN